MATGGFAAAIFDMDGLLVDSEPLWHETEIEILGHYGVPLTVALCRTTAGRFVREVTRHWYERFPWLGPGPDEVAARIVDAMAERLATRAQLVAGATHALRFLRARGVRLALASSSPQRLIDVVVSSCGLEGWFEVIHSAESEPAGKPDPSVFLTTARLLGVDPGRCVVLEDSVAGVAAARAAGMACIAVPGEELALAAVPGVADATDDGGGQPALETVAGADLVLRSLGELDEQRWAELCRGVPGKTAGR